QSSRHQKSSGCPIVNLAQPPPARSKNDGPLESLARLAPIAAATLGSFAPPDQPRSAPACPPLHSSRSFRELSQKRLNQPAIYRNQVSRCAARLRPRQKQNRRRAILGIDRLVRQSPLRVKFRQLLAQPFIASSFLKRDSIFLQRSHRPFP